jgi:hypothetical protein
MLKAGDKYVQVAPVNECYFDYVGREFTIQSVGGNYVTVFCEGLGVSAMDVETFNNHFKINQNVKANNNKRIIRNGWATIVILEDGSKGVSKCGPDDEYDADKGLEIATLRAEIKSMNKRLKNLVR